jgi:hypothetical protein
MSSIWTPGGEHRVPREDSSGPAAEPQLSAEEQARLEETADEVAAVRAQLAAAPPEQVVANHVIGLYELAAIHLSQQPPRLDAARLAIDALGGMLDACHGRLGEVEATLGAARSQIQMAFVGASRSHAEQPGSGGERTEAGSEDPPGPAAAEGAPDR